MIKVVMQPAPNTNDNITRWEMVRREELWWELFLDPFQCWDQRLEKVID